MDEDENSGATRDDTGKFSTKYEPDDFVEALRQLGGAGSTREIADKVGCARRTAHYRLSNLQEDSRVDSREVGKSILWQVTDDDG